MMHACRADQKRIPRRVPPLSCVRIHPRPRFHEAGGFYSSVATLLTARFIRQLCPSVSRCSSGANNERSTHNAQGRASLIPRGAQGRGAYMYAKRCVRNIHIAAAAIRPIYFLCKEITRLPRSRGIANYACARPATVSAYVMMAITCTAFTLREYAAPRSKHIRLRCQGYAASMYGDV